MKVDKHKFTHERCKLTKPPFPHFSTSFFPITTPGGSSFGPLNSHLFPPLFTFYFTLILLPVFFPQPSLHLPLFPLYFSQSHLSSFLPPPFPRVNLHALSSTSPVLPHHDTTEQVPCTYHTSSATIHIHCLMTCPSPHPYPSLSTSLICFEPPHPHLPTPTFLPPPSYTFTHRLHPHFLRPPSHRYFSASSASPFSLPPNDTLPFIVLTSFKSYHPPPSIHPTSTRILPLGCPIFDTTTTRHPLCLLLPHHRPFTAYHHYHHHSSHPPPLPSLSPHTRFFASAFPPLLFCP